MVSLISKPCVLSPTIFPDLLSTWTTACMASVTFTMGATCRQITTCIDDNQHACLLVGSRFPTTGMITDH